MKFKLKIETEDGELVRTYDWDSDQLEDKELMGETLHDMFDTLDAVNADRNLDHYHDMKYAPAKTL